MKSQQLPLAVLLGLDRQLDVGPVETQHQRFDPLGEQPGGDVVRVLSSAVAVTAMIGTLGKMCRSRDRSSYSGRNAGPHCEMQCASSMAIRLMSSLASASSMRSVISRSGAR